MAIDPSIILGVKPVQLDNPLDVARQAQSLQALGYQNQNAQREMQTQSDLRNAYSQAMTAGPDGMPTIDRQKVYQGLQNNPMALMGEQQKFQAQDASKAKMDLERIKDQHEQAANLLSSIPRGPGVDPAAQQAAWEKANAQAVALGFPGAQNAPKQYPGDSFVQNALVQTMGAKDQMDRQLKMSEFAQREKDRQLQREKLNFDKVDKYTKDMKNDLDADKGRAGNFGLISGKVQSAERLQTLIGAFKDGNLPAAQQEELALGLSNMLAPGGGGSREQVAALVPKSAIGDANKLASWLMNEPRGSGQQAFTDMMAHTIDREKQVATDQLNNIRANRVSAHGALRQIAPQVFNAQLRSYGMDPANIDANGNYKVPSGQTSFHQMSDDELDKAYRAAGGK